MPHGEHAIDTLHVSDVVLAEDPHTGKVEPERVQRGIADGVKPLLVVAVSDGSAITVTANHPFYVDSGARFVGPGWLAAGHLRVGDRLRTAGGHDVTVTGLRPHGGQAMVYTLTIAHDHTFWGESGPGSGDHDFFVGTARVLVHNTNGCFGVASEIEDLGGKTFQDADRLLRQRASRVSTTPKGYTRYQFPDKSEVWIRPDGEVIRLAAPEYGPNGARINRGQRLDPTGNPIPRSQEGAHNTGERVIR